MSIGWTHRDELGGHIVMREIQESYDSRQFPICKLCGRWATQRGDLCMFHVRWHLALYEPNGRHIFEAMQEADAAEDLNIAKFEKWAS